MIISVDIEKAFDKIQQQIHNPKNVQTRNARALLQKKPL